MKAALIAIALFISVIPSFADDSEKSIETFDDKLTVRTFFLVPHLDFSITSGDFKSDDIDYSANTPLSVGASLFYKSFGLSVSKEAQNSQDKNVYGKTSFTDIQIYYYSRKYACDASYQKYKGYYLENAGSYGYVQGDANSRRPDIRALNIGFDFYYIFSDNFSFNAFMNQTERQNKWDWSFLLLGSFNQFNLSSNRSLIPDSQKSFFGNDADYTGGKYSVLSIAPGLAISIPFYNFFISAAMFAGYGISLSKDQNSHGTISGTDASVKINMKVGFGYNGDKFFTGMSISLDSTAPIKDGAKASHQTFSGYVDLYLGTRFL
jgi:hypothetical protein